MGSSKRILIITDQSLKPIKFFIDQMPKLAKGLIRLGHDARIISYSQLLRAMSPFKSRRISAYLYKQKVDEKIAELALHYQPNIVYISFAKFLDAETIEMVRHACPQAVIIGGDGDPWPSLQEGRIDTAKSLDFLIATNDGTFLEEYRSAGVKNCCFMPNMCDPDIDHRYEVESMWKTEILWTGAARHSANKDAVFRETLVKEIAKRENTSIYGCLQRPQIGGRNYLYAISGARIGVNVNAYDSVKFCHSDRLTQYLACGTLVMAKRFEGCERLYKDGVHLRYFDTIEEFLGLVDHYMSQEQERKKIADGGMDWVHQEYNSQKIAQYILDLVEKGHYSAPWNS